VRVLNRTQSIFSVETICPLPPLLLVFLNDEGPDALVVLGAVEPRPVVVVESEPDLGGPEVTTQTHKLDFVCGESGHRDGLDALRGRDTATEK
jgi:hypothetical protein